MSHVNLDRLQSTYVLGYIRVSSGEQAKGWSLGSQREAIAAFCAQRSLPLQQVFEDPGRSGHSVQNRRGLLSLIRCLQSGQYGAVIVWREDRLGRRITDNQDISAAITDTGAALITLEPLSIDLGPDQAAPGLDIRQLHQILAEHEWHQIRSRIIPNLTAATASGVRGGHTPFGYVRIDRESFVVDSERAAVVMEVFQHVEQGNSIRSVTGELTRRQITDHAGKELTVDRIRHMLRNRFYLGEHRWQVPRSMQEQYGTCVEIADHHPAIVDPALFDRVQCMLDQRAPRAGQAPKAAEHKPRTKLTVALRNAATLRPVHGILPPVITRCGQCGSKVYARLQTRGSRTKRYKAAVYECERHKTHGKVACSQPPVLVDEIDPIVIARVQVHLSRTAQPHAAAPAGTHSSALLHVIAQFTAEIERLRAATALAPEGVVAVLQARLTASETTLADLERRQHAAPAPAPHAPGAAAQVRADPQLWPGLTVAEQREALTTLLAAAVIDDRALKNLGFADPNDVGAP
ncbi:MAG: recombinase family protein [Planctomycetota bacterium]|jgi:site-specific DNA recombinase|nr:recombinase family protein [Planctomycetota bacterium]